MLRRFSRTNSRTRRLSRFRSTARLACCLPIATQKRLGSSATPPCRSIHLTEKKPTRHRSPRFTALSMSALLESRATLSLLKSLMARQHSALVPQSIGRLQARGFLARAAIIYTWVSRLRPLRRLLLRTSRPLAVDERSRNPCFARRFLLDG